MQDSILLPVVNSAINQIISLKQSTERGIKEPEKLLSIMENILDVISDAESRQTEVGVKVWLQNLQKVVSVLNNLLDEVQTTDRREENILEKIQKVLGITSTSLNRKILDVWEKLDDMTTTGIENFGFVKKVYKVRKPSETHGVIGRDSEKGIIIRELLKNERNDHTLPVFAIVGAVGLGKTTLAKSVFHDGDIRGHFDLLLWANVSFERFNLRMFVARILGMKDTHESLDRLQKELRQKLNGKKFLLVLDGIRSMNLLQLDDLQELLTNKREGNKILATTRSDEVAYRMDYLIELRPLPLSEDKDKDYSWQIFAESAGFLKDNQDKHKNLVEMGKELVKSCKGVPLALKILGGILNRSTDETTWMRVKGNEMWKQPDLDSKYFLKLSFDELSQPLKVFFAYCAVVSLTSNPPDKERIMQMWVAQADVRPSSHKRLEDVANEYFDELSSRFFFKDIEEDDLCQVTRFELHDCISIPDCMQRLTSSVHSNTKVSDMQYVYCKTDHISESSLIWKFSNSLRNSEKLGTFLFLREQKTSDKLFSTFKRLRVMDLCLSQFEVLPSSISYLKHLRYLDLSRNEKIRQIPTSIGDLDELETLRTDGCKMLTELPSQVWELKNLRNLYASSLQTALPENIPSSPLQTLRLDSFKGLKEFSKAKSWSHLETLGILYCPELCLSKDDMMSKSLRNVTIVGLPKLTEIPPWLKDSAGSLESLYIAECQYLKTLPDWIVSLTNLKRLTIRDCFGFTSLTDNKARLPDGLKLLRICQCPRLTKRCQRERGEDWSAIAHVEEIYVDYYDSILKPARSSDLLSSSGPAVVTAIAEPVSKTILQELNYIIRPKKYVNEMRSSVESLKHKHNIVLQAVSKAQRFGQSIKPEVLMWLELAGNIIAQADLLKDSNKRRWVDSGSRYKKNKGAVGISERITEVLRETPDITHIVLPPQPPALLYDPDFMEFESTKETMNQITEALKDACGVVGIFGLGGIGKTSIVKKIAEKVKQDKQFDKVIMAVVSPSPDLKKIQDQISSMLDLPLNQRAGNESRASMLYHRIMNEKSILVILDDVWAWLDLTKIGIPGFLEHNGCKVMLTTRSEDVCTSMGRGNGKKIKVGVLSKEESWELFKSNAGGDGIETWPDLKEVAMNVMNECQGLPLALKTVGRALHSKDIREWESAKLQLKKSSYTNIEGMSQEVISCLRLSYDYLEGEEAAKVCFLTCCLFPEDFDIPMEMLARYAVGKGLFPYANTINEARTLTHTTLGKLKASCLLLEGDYPKEECVKVHDVVRDVGLSIASEAKLLSISGPDLGRWLQRNSMKHVKGACFATEEAVALPEGIQCPELEELILRGRQVDYSDAFFQTMKELKVLIHDGRSRLPTSLKCSVSLRTLHLVGCELGDVSSALGELKMLEILTINRTDIESLPVEVGQLRNLRLLDLLENNDLKRSPGNVISQLSQLEELCIGASFDDWEIEGTSGDVEKASLSELQSLPCLAILFVRVRDYAQFPPKFSIPNKLIKFEISVGAGYDMDRYPMSRKLRLREGEFQIEGVKSLLRLIDGRSKYEFTSDGNGSNYVLTDLARGLNGLDSLSIESVDWISSLTSCATTNEKVVPVFANLQYLTLDNVKSLRGLASGEGIEGTTTATSGGILPPGSLHHLKVLEIHDCNDIEGWAVPWSWTYGLRSLEKVIIGNCYNVKGLFEVKEENINNSTHFPVLSNLREIKLEGLHQLRSLTNGESSAIHFSNLEVVNIFMCESLVSVFTPNVVYQGLVHLETLQISYCSGLKVIFEESDTNSSSSPNLKTVYVVECPQLKSIFTVSMAKGLPKLEQLHLWRNQNLEEIVSCKQNRAAAEENIEINDAESSYIFWPQIRRIYIEESRKFKRFCPGNSRIEMPMLQEFQYINCSDWMENLAADPPAHGLNIPQSANIITDETERQKRKD